MALSRIATLSLLTAAALAGAAGEGPARAADMPSWPAVPARPQFTELASGWYLRGDIGWRFNGVGSVTASNPVASFSYADAMSGGLGVGYKYQWFRADVTVDRGVPARFAATSAGGASQPQYTSKIGSVTALANAYIDLGTWSGFTPYVGAGAGVSWLRADNYNDTALPMNPNVRATSEARNFTWAAMAGVSYQFAPSWVVDVGYRYLDLGSIESTASSGFTSDRTAVKKLTAQEVRVGVRFLFD